MGETSPVEDSTPAVKRAIAAEIEKRTLEHVEAMNRRDFSPSSVLYRFRHPDWRAEAGWGQNMGILTLEEYMESLREITKEYPEWKLTVLNMTTTVNEKMDHARIFVNIKAEAIPPPIWRHTIALVVLRKFNGEWLAWRHCVMTGMRVLGESVQQDGSS